MTSTSCYKIAPIAPSTPIIMESPASAITEILLSTLIFSPSIVEFNNDTDAYTTVDIN
jgi:hypothetical protein